MSDAMLGKMSYHAYGSMVDRKNFQGNPMPEWDELTPQIQQAWIAAATAAKMRGELAAIATVRDALTEDDMNMIRFAAAYAMAWSNVPLPGANLLRLLAKLAKALGF